jgi:uncharacterized protein (UPF0261 family)
MRTSPEETAELGRRIAAKLNNARGPLTLFVPLRGVSAISTEGAPFADPEADAALVAALRDNLNPSIDARYLDTDVNDPAFARAMADTLHAHYQTWRSSATTAGAAA